MAALESRSPSPADLEFVSFLTTSAVLEGAQATSIRYRHRTFFVGSDVRALSASGRLDYVPICLEEVPRLLASGRLPIDVALLQVSPPDARGFVSLGVSVDLAPAILAVARTVIAEVNPAMPRTYGESFVHIDRFDAFVSVDTPVTEYRHPPAGEAAERVARYIAAIIEDGSTLQIGLGRLPNEALHVSSMIAVTSASTADVITDGLVDLVEAGVVTGRRKTLHRDRIVTSYCLGTRRLYDFVDDNPLLNFLPIDEVCDPGVVAANFRMVSITQAFAIDCTGQVCVDQFEGEFYGGISTQAAFIRERPARPTASPSSASPPPRKTGASRIKPLLETGDGVGIARSDVHYVVTEYGIAYLFGKSIRERALALIEVAHPDHRESLLEAAKQLGYVPREQYLASQGAYPVHEERRISLANGAEVLLRPARAADADGLRALFHMLSPNDVYTRFFREVRSLSYQDIQTLCNVNHETQVAFLAVDGTEGERGDRGQRLLLPEPDHESRRGRLHGGAAMAGAWPRNCPADPSPGVRGGSGSPRVHRGDPSPQYAHGALGLARQRYGDHGAGRGCGSFHRPLRRHWRHPLHRGREWPKTLTGRSSARHPPRQRGAARQPERHRCLEAGGQGGALLTGLLHRSGNSRPPPRAGPQRSAAAGTWGTGQPTGVGEDRPWKRRLIAG